MFLDEELSNSKRMNQYKEMAKHYSNAHREAGACFFEIYGKGHSISSIMIDNMNFCYAPEDGLTFGYMVDSFSTDEESGPIARVFLEQNSKDTLRFDLYFLDENKIDEVYPCYAEAHFVYCPSDDLVVDFSLDRSEDLDIQQSNIKQM